MIAEERVAGAPMVSTYSRCSGVRRVQQQARHADDAVHGRADLVAHGREEGALGGVRGVRRRTGLARRGEEPGIVEGDRGELCEALQALDLGGAERSLVGGVPRDAEGPDRVGAREQRDAHECADALAREGVHPPLPRVVALDHQRCARLPDAGLPALRRVDMLAELLLEDAGRDAAHELLAVRAPDVQVSVRRAQELACAGEQLAQQIADVEAVHNAERRLVQRAELGIFLEAQFLGAVGDALLESFQRLSELGGHGVECRGEHADLVMGGDRGLAVESKY